jgi:phytoene/squalene synthetase
VRVLNSSHCDQMLMKGSRPAHREPVTLVTSPDVEQHHVQDTTPKLQDVIAAARQNVSDAESRDFEELTGYGYIIAMKRDNGPTECTSL